MVTKRSTWEKIKDPRATWDKIRWTWLPETNREAGDSVVRNFLLHWFPAKVTRQSLSWNYSFWLGTISAVLFLILIITGIPLMFLYVPLKTWSLQFLTAGFSEDYIASPRT